MRNRKEKCGKRCVGTYCGQHNYQLKKGMKMPEPCRGCGVGLLCDYRLCISCGGSALKHRLIRKRKKAKKAFELVLLVAQNIEESCELSEAIQNLPPELREIILKEFVAIKIKEKKEMGWCDVHEELENLPYCEKQGQITKVFSCPKCRTCKLTGLCVACYKNEKDYHTLVGREEVDEIEEKKFVKTWGQTKLLSEINEQFKKACIAYKQKEKEALRWLEVTRATRT